MKILKNILIASLFALPFTSCNFLDKYPYEITQEGYFQTEDEANSALTGIYAILAQSSFYGGDYLLIAGGDDLGFYGGSSGRISTTGLISNLATTSDPVITALWFTLYNGIERANYFLERVDDVQNISAAKLEQYKAEARFLRAFYYFHLVQNWGDVPFVTKSTTSSESVSNKDKARTSKDVIYQFIVDEMSEVSDEDQGGLLTAQALNYKPGRISKTTAWGILARVYLFWAGEYNRDKIAEPADNIKKYEQALFFAKKVIDSGVHELSGKYWDTFIDVCSNKYDSSGKHESMWEVEFAGNYTSDVKAEGRIGNTIGLSAPDFSTKKEIIGKADPGYAYAFIWSTPKLYRLYDFKIAESEDEDHGEQDDRFIWNIAPFGYRTISGKQELGVVGRTFECKKLYDWVMSTEGYGSVSNDYGLCSVPLYQSGSTLEGDVYKSDTNEDQRRMDLCCAKFRREYEADKKSKNFTSINFPILRYSDVLLMMAEAENEVNGPKNAYQYINEVRQRAGVSDLQAGLSQSDFRNSLKDERARELCFEYLRRYDLIRWGEYITNMNELVSQAQNGTNWQQGEHVAPFFQIPEAYNYLPIPDSERAVNKLITTNNPGW